MQVAVAADPRLLSSRLLHLVLMPTEQCNLRCEYCYEDFANGQMSDGVVESVKNLLHRRAARLELLSIEWFGGEPLLAWPIVESIQEEAHSLAQARPDLVLSGSMTTNASMLTIRKFERLLELGVSRFQVSLDGPKELHDASRHTARRKGSFDAVWKNLLAIRRSDLDCTVFLRMHVWPSSWRRLLGWLPDLSYEIGCDRRFLVDFRAVRQFGGSCSSTLEVLSGRREQMVLRELRTEAEGLGLASVGDPLLLEGAIRGCYASATHSYVVRSTGELAKCTVALDHPRNKLGRLNEDGTVSLDAELMLGWTRGALESDPKTAACPAHGWVERPPDEGLVVLGEDRYRGASA